jgi:hypothetical protein
MRREISAKSATNGTFAVEKARLDFSVRLVGSVTRILPVRYPAVTIQALKRALVIDQASRLHSGHRPSPELVGNQFVIATYAPPCQKTGVLSKDRRRPLFENFSLLALLHDCT